MCHTQAGLLLGCLEVMIEDVVAEATGTGSLSNFCFCCMPDLPNQTRLETIDRIYTYLGHSCSAARVMVRPHQLRMVGRVSTTELLGLNCTYLGQPCSPHQKACDEKHDHDACLGSSPSQRQLAQQAAAARQQWSCIQSSCMQQPLQWPCIYVKTGIDSDFGPCKAVLATKQQHQQQALQP